MTSRRETGAALVMTLFLLLVVSAAGAALCLRVTGTTRSNVVDRERLAARCAAQGGVERARWALARDAAWSGETLRIGALEVTVRADASSDGRRVVHCVASSPSSRAAVTATLRLTPALPAIDSWHDW